MMDGPMVWRETSAAIRRRILRLVDAADER
jgi:hypothetical protein